MCTRVSQIAGSEHRSEARSSQAEGTTDAGSSPITISDALTGGVCGFYKVGRSIVMTDKPRPTLPIPTPETRPYWEAAKRHVLLIQRCSDCREVYFYPRPLCPRCMSSRVEWVEASGKGKLHSFVINHRPPRHLPKKEPIIIAIVELDEGPRMMTNLVGVEPDPVKLCCDARVEVVFEDLSEEIALPMFRLAKPATRPE
jgi:hypothetical protein